MRKALEGTMTCPACGHIIQIEGWPIISKHGNAEVAQRLMRGILFEVFCPECGYFDVLTYTSVYLDEDADAVIVLGRTFKNELYASDELFKRIQANPAFDVRTVRWVAHVDEMSEKARIFDCGLDDRAIEVAKLMLLRWLAGKDELHGMSQVYFDSVLENGDLLFKLLAISDTDNGEIAFFRNEYEQIEAGVLMADPYDVSVKIDRAWAERFLAEETARDANAALRGCASRPRRTFARTADELRKVFESMGLVGKTIASVDVVGKMVSPTHQSIIDLYNNMLRAEGEPYRRGMISEDEIPLDCERMRSVAPRGPLVIGFQDGSTVEISFDGASEASVACGQVGERQPNREVDAAKILRPIIGETVSSVEVIGAAEGSYEGMCAKKEGREDPFKYVLIRCKDHMLYITWTYTCAVMHNDANLSPLTMTMGELKDSISYYGELFD